MLAGIGVVTPYISPDTTRCVYAQYSIRVKNRDKFTAHMTSKNIPTAVHYPVPIHMQGAYRYLEYKKGDFPVSEKVASEIVSLPMHPFLKEEEMKTIVQAIKETL
jgi:UDP-2-acetamido-2-deoxy-ribo-hexuluronate aminotransferase